MQTINFKKIKLHNGNKILDVGCGEGRHSIGAYIEAEVQVIGVDLNEHDLATAQERFQQFAQPDKEARSFALQKADALKLPFPDNTFDRVICSEVLEHIPDYRGVLKEIDRVLKPEGLLAISVPRAWPEEICWRLSEAYHRVEGGHIRIFNAHQLRKDVEYMGWTRYARHWAHALHVPYWWLKCLFWGRDAQSRSVQLYHRFLVWDLIKAPLLNRVLDRVLNPIMGKSVVMYFERNTTMIREYKRFENTKDK